MTDAHISIHQIVCSWLGKRGYTIHYYVDALWHATEAVRELSFTSMPLLYNVLLTRAVGDKYFRLPKKYSGYVQIGVRYGDEWFPLAVNERLMPYPNNIGRGDLDAAEFADDLNITGGFASWYAGQNTTASFNGAQFSGQQFSTASSTTPTSPPAPNGSNPFAVWQATFDGVSFDEAQGLIAVPELFPFTEIYLVYTGAGSIDNVTSIPAKAQAAVEAYIDWKYAANKTETSRSEAADWERKWDAQHRLLRARLQPFSIEDVARSFTQGTFYRNHHGIPATSFYGRGDGGRTIEVVTLHEFDIEARTNTNILQDSSLAGVNVSRISYAGQSYNKTFFTKNIADDFLTLTTPGVTFYPGLTVTITPK